MLQPHHFSYKCPLKLADLDQVNGAYYCSQCRKDIHDLTNCSLDEVHELQQRHGSICGFVRLVGVTSMLSLAACSKGDKGGQPAATQNEAPKPPENERVLMGDVSAPELIPPSKLQPPEEQTPPAETSDVQVEPEKPIPPKEGQPDRIDPPPLPPIMMGVICPPMPNKQADPNSPV